MAGVCREIWFAAFFVALYIFLKLIIKASREGWGNFHSTGPRTTFKTPSSCRVLKPRISSGTPKHRFSALKPPLEAKKWPRAHRMRKCFFCIWNSGWGKYKHMNTHDKCITIHGHFYSNRAECTENTQNISDWIPDKISLWGLANTEILQCPAKITALLFVGLIWLVQTWRFLHQIAFCDMAVPAVLSQD